MLCVVVVTSFYCIRQDPMLVNEMKQLKRLLCDKKQNVTLSALTMLGWITLSDIDTVFTGVS